MYFSVVNMFEWEGVAGQPAKKVGEITWDYLKTFDVRQAELRPSNTSRNTRRTTSHSSWT